MKKHKNGPRLKKSVLHKRKIKLWLKYSTWKKVFCPALKEPVHFTRLGWNHLVERKRRTKVEYFRRLEALPLAKSIIQKSTTTQSRNFNNGIEYVNLVSFESVRNAAYKVTLTRTGRRYTFFSIRRVV